ncbi:hypothetical protein D088_910097 [Salmonella enterica subsp. houtenae serovar 16:z4,z32:-- str. RKS3027]|nr:hypothetical protein D088_910097 [Salmonella enterica subsp. houtenae serovar 16:z4,z32:-- str. RKS3027]
MNEVIFWCEQTDFVFNDGIGSMKPSLNSENTVRPDRNLRSRRGFLLVRKD